jgi:polyisoprenoid-binding protein YceI
MRVLCVLLACFFFSFSPQGSNIYMSKNIKTVIYSEAPLENIEATSVKGSSVLNISNGEIQFIIPISSFQFKKSLMQEHFNENYMESDKYPAARFKGKINQDIDINKDGDYQVTATGELEVHGVKKQRTINGSIHVDNKKISINSKFEVLCKDHNIKIPQLVFQNIAENIQLTVTGTYTAYSSAQP